MRTRIATGLALVLIATLLRPGPVEGKPGGHPRRRSVDAIIIHSLGGPDCRDGRRVYRTIEGDARTWMATFNRLPIVSIHYLIDRDGRVEAGVPESIAATHAVGWNQRSIGIELVNNGDGVDPFPAAQLQALARLVAAIRERHPAVTPQRILRHSDVDQSTFPPDRFDGPCTSQRRKLDPGDAFPWVEFVAGLAP